MSKLRVHELAKEIGKTNKDVMDFLKSKNIDVKSHMSTVEDADVDMVRTNFRKGNMTAASTDTEEKPKKKLIGVLSSAECKSSAGTQKQTAAGKWYTAAEQPSVWQ